MAPHSSLPSDALSQHLPSYLGFSYLGCGVSLYGCSSKAQPLLQQSAAAAPYLGCQISPHHRYSWPWMWTSFFRPSWAREATAPWKSRKTWSNRQIWPWITEWSRAKANRVLPSEHTGHTEHPLPTTQEKTIHMDITRWSIPKSDLPVITLQILWWEEGVKYYINE